MKGKNKKLKKKKGERTRWIGPITIYKNLLDDFETTMIISDIEKRKWNV